MYPHRFVAEHMKTSTGRVRPGANGAFFGRLVPVKMDQRKKGARNESPRASRSSDSETASSESHLFPKTKNATPQSSSAARRRWCKNGHSGPYGALSGPRGPYRAPKKTEQRAHVGPQTQAHV
jgi:hypothetical protein